MFKFPSDNCYGVVMVFQTYIIGGKLRLRVWIIKSDRQVIRFVAVAGTIPGINYLITEIACTFQSSVEKV
jgi:hypothetical protein